MNLVKDINRFRKVFFTGATNHLANKAEAIKVSELESVRKILLCRPNQRLGNLLLITPLIQELELTFPGAKIDLIVKGGLANVLFEQYASINAIYQLPKKPFRQPLNYLKNYIKVTGNRYDLVINATDDSSSGRILTKKSKGTYKLFGKPFHSYWGDREDMKHIAKKPILALRELSGRSRVNPMPRLDLRLTHQELAHGREVLQDLTKNHKKTICIFTFATGHKMHSKDWWNKLYLEMKLHFKDHNVIEILPMEHVSQIDFKAPTFYGTDIRELGAVMAACEVFVGADSGIMHLASAVHVPTLGLFNVTDAGMYRPYNELSQAIDSNELNHMDIIGLLQATSERKKNSQSCGGG